jgi:membrane-associated protein
MSRRHIMESCMILSIIESFFSFAIHIDTYLFSLVESYGYWLLVILFIIVFCETGLVITPFLPGDSLLFAVGTVAGAGFINVFLCIAVLLCAAVIGDAVNYEIGRHAGPAIFKKETRFLNKKHLIKAHLFYERHGGKAIILARFIPVIRTFAPFVAGIALMNPAQFFFFNIIGATAWVTGLVFMGFFLGNIPIVQENFSIVIYSIIIISISPVVFGFIRSILKKKG